MNTIKAKNARSGTSDLQSGAAIDLGLSQLLNTGTHVLGYVKRCRLDYYNSTLSLPVNTKFYDETPSL